MRSFVISLLAMCLFGIAHALSATGNRLLVVLDEPSEKDRYSKFFGDLQGQGYKITFSSPKDDPALFLHGARAQDHLLLLPTKRKALGPALSPNILLNFLKADGNILLTLSANTPTPASIASLLLELDIQLPPDRSSLVVDHFNYDTISAKQSHDVLLLPHPEALRDDVKNYFGGEGLLAFPHGVGQVLGAQSPLLTPILRAPRTAYAYNPKDDGESMEELFGSGQQLSLISAVQARNSARFTVLGSTEMLEDIWLDASVQRVKEKKQVKNGNREFVKRVAQWTFKELGVLKVGQVEHWLDEDENYIKPNDTEGSIQRRDVNPAMYRIKNQVTFSVELSEHTPTGAIPFIPPASDSIQLEFTLLSPYQRLSLRPAFSTPNSTAFVTTFPLPDQHGIFAFCVNYKRPFLTPVDEKLHVTVRHFAHDEWPRSWEISGAWVWVFGVYATVAGWVAFVALWLYSKPVDVVGVKKTQ